MTADDFFLLFVAFGGFVVVPALLLWGFARFADRTQSRSRGPGSPTDVDSTDAPGGDGSKEAARSEKADGFPSSAQHRYGPQIAAAIVSSA
jgi:hypothetical protein